MAEDKHFWLISVPPSKGGESRLSELNRVIVNELDVAQYIHKFELPDLRVGSIDQLISLSDELKRISANVEQTLRRIATQYFEIQKSSKLEKMEIDVRGASADRILTHFKWDDARYHRRKPLPELVESMKNQVTKLDQELRNKSSEFNSLTSKVNQMESTMSGSLLTRNLTNDLKTVKIVESHYLTTLFVVVPRSWEKTYESLSENVVPGSSFKITEDHEHALFTVVVFKREMDEFRAAARLKRFTVRKVGDTASTTEADMKKLNAKYAKSKKVLLRWTLTNFGEVFLTWAHLLCIQCFVESILRYGLPANYDAMLILPRMKSSSKLEKKLCELYQDVSNDFGSAGDASLDDAGVSSILGHEKYFPYVFIDVNIDMR